MSTLSTSRALSVGNLNKSREFNEFASIEGLGPAMLRWLRESFSVYTVADLANLSVNLVLSRLEDEEKAFCRSEIERWIKQAQEFTLSQSSWQTFATFVVSLQSRQIGGQTEQRTTAYFLEADRKKTWSGVECHGVYNLMLDQLKHAFHLESEVISQMEPETNNQPETMPESQSEPITDLKPEANSQLEDAVEQADPEPKTSLPLEPNRDEQVMPAARTVEIEKAIPFETSQEISTATIKITQIEVFQPPQATVPIVIDMPQRERPIVLQRNQPFQFEVTLQLAGMEVIELMKQQIPYRVEITMRNRHTLEISPPRFTVSSFVEGERTYKSQVETIVPESGLYSMQIVAKPDRGYVRTDYFELPFVQVI